VPLSPRSRMVASDAAARIAISWASAIAWLCPSTRWWRVEISRVSDSM